MIDLDKRLASLPDSARKNIFEIVDATMHGDYRSYYFKYGIESVKRGNVRCPNSAAHANGDTNHSCSIDDITGRFKCHGCGISGNFQSYWKQFAKDKFGGRSYLAEMVEQLHLEHLVMLEEKDLVKQVDEARSVLEKFKEAEDEVTKPTVAIPDSTKQAYEDNLQNNTEALGYMKAERNASPELLKTLGVGLDANGRYMFPVFDANGTLVNYKLYDPRCTDVKSKWRFLHAGTGETAFPFENLYLDSIMIMEGQPDVVCAMAMGLDHAITFGSATNTDVVKIFGVNKAREFFTGKKISILFDADDAGTRGSQLLAKSLYQFTKEIRVLDLSRLINTEIS